MKRKIIVKHLIGGLMLALTIAAAARAADRPEGRWISQSGNVEVEIAPCGGALCGTVVRVMANRSMDGPGASTAPPARVGLRIISGLTPSGDGRWTGTTFDRESGRTYDVVITPLGRTMIFRPYVLTPLFGKSQTWTRAAT
jgi:uncharacterized protein (DUF2147 family)